MDNQERIGREQALMVVWKNRGWMIASEFSWLCIFLEVSLLRDVLTQMRHFERVWKDGRITFLSTPYHDETEVAPHYPAHLQKSEDPRNLNGDDEDDEPTDL